MLELKYIEQHTDLIKQQLLRRNWKEENLAVIDEIIETNEKRVQTQQELDEAKRLNNQHSAEIQGLYKSGQKEEGDRLRAVVVDLKERIKHLEDRHRTIASKLEEMLFQVPNRAHETVPPGMTDEDNELVREGQDSLPELTESKHPHWELAETYDIIDFGLAAKISGSGFALYKGDGARLQRALISFFLDQATAAGYTEYLPPYMVNEASARGTGQLPDKEGQMYHTQDGQYLIPTAEVPLTNIYRDVILDESDLPVRITGYTPCFRREAGSYGADVKGLNRLHQFDKIEIVQVVHPDKSYEVLDAMVSHVESLLKALELPYRIVRLCGGDLGFAAALTYDFEVYSAAQEKWLEVSSISNFETFQSNRLKLRYRDDNGKKHLAHTLNGSALALARIVAALLENNQTGNGIKIPTVLQSYMGKKMITK